MYREWKKIEFTKGYYIWIWEQQDWEVDQAIDVQRMEENRIHKRVLYMNLGTTRLRSRPRNRCTENGRK